MTPVDSNGHRILAVKTGSNGSLSDRRDNTATVGSWEHFRRSNDQVIRWPSAISGRSKSLAKASRGAKDPDLHGVAVFLPSHHQYAPCKEQEDASQESDRHSDSQHRGVRNKGRKNGGDNHNGTCC